MTRRLVCSFVLLAFALALSPLSPAHADPCVQVRWGESDSSASRPDGRCEPVPPFIVNGVCNEFDYLQAVLAAEGLAQPPEAHLEMARVLLSKPPCFLDRNWLASWGAAVDYAADPIKYANSKTHFLKYYMLNEYLTPEQREPLAIAAHIALTEQPRIERHHFDAVGSTAYWWSAPQACPTIFGFRTISYTEIIEYIPIRSFVVGQVKVC